MCDDRVSINILNALGCRTSKDIIHRRQIVATSDSIFVSNKRIVEYVDAFHQAGSPVIFTTLGVIHQPDPNARIIFDQVMLNVDDAVTRSWITNKLDTILPVADKLVIADGGVEGRTDIVLEADFDTILKISPDDIVLHDCFRLIIEIHAIVGVIFKNVAAYQTTAVAEVDAISVRVDMVIQNV